MSKIVGLDGAPLIKEVDTSDLITVLERQYDERMEQVERHGKELQQCMESHVKENYPDLEINKCWEFSDPQDSIDAQYSRVRTTNCRVTFQADPSQKGKVLSVAMMVHFYMLDSDGKVKGFHESGLTVKRFMELFNVSSNQKYIAPESDA